MLLDTAVISKTRPATDIKKSSAQHVHLFELIERHKNFILARGRWLNGHGREGSLVGPLAVGDTGTLEPRKEHLVDPAAAVDEWNDDHGKRDALLDVAPGADAPTESSRMTTSTTCRQCSAWLAAKRRAVRPKPVRISE
jgi:hypothetical protein